jgi:hypothetical protein
MVFVSELVVTVVVVLEASVVQSVFVETVVLEVVAPGEAIGEDLPVSVEVVLFSALAKVAVKAKSNNA